MRRIPPLSALPLALALAAGLAAPAVQAETPAALAAAYAREAGAPPSAERGQQFFTTRHGAEWACASCHGAVPVQAGRHAATGRTIAALAPAANPARLTDPAKVEKWLGRNCKDVAGRACSAQEKADVLTWLNTLQP